MPVSHNVMQGAVLDCSTRLCGTKEKVGIDTMYVFSDVLESFFRDGICSIECLLSHVCNSIM